MYFLYETPETSMSITNIYVNVIIGCLCPESWQKNLLSNEKFIFYRVVIKFILSEIILSKCIFTWKWLKAKFMIQRCWKVQRLYDPQGT